MFARGSRSAAAPGGLRVEHLEDYAGWVRLAVGFAAVAYALMTALRFATGVGPWWSTEELWACLSCGLALFLVRKGRTRQAALLTLGTVWLELMTGAIVSPDGIRSGSALGLGIFVLGAGLLLGSRAALVAAAGSAAAFPAAVLLGAALGVGPGIGAGDLRHLVTLVLSTLGIGLLLSALLRALGRTVRRVRDHAAYAQELFDSAPDPIVALADNGRVEALNPQAEAALRCSRGPTEGRPLGDLDVFDLGGNELTVRDLERWRGGSRELRSRRTGAYLEARVRRAARPDGHRGWILVLRDVSERRAAKERERALEEQLHHAQKLEALGQLAGGVAHDFNNLLTAMGGNAELLADSEDPEVQELARELITVQERGVALTRQLLGFARRDAPRPRAVSLSQVIEGAAKLVQRILGEPIFLHLDLAPGCVIVADPGQIEQVLLNLATNARDAMPEGGTLYMGCRAVGERIELEVRDTGVGMDLETSERIFEPFFTTKALGKGTGLGLSTVRELVDKAGGTIAVDSEVGRGTVFHLSWPRSEAPASPSTSAPVLVRAGLGGARVLLVDDDEHTRVVVARLLQRHGATVKAVARPAEALAWVARSSGGPQLLLTDLWMPGMTGLQLACAVTERFPDIAVLYMSGHGAALETRLPIDPEEDLLTKPFSTEQLVGMVELKLGRRRARPQLVSSS